MTRYDFTAKWIRYDEIMALVLPHTSVLLGRDRGMHRMKWN
eukprot:CAMPEP_0201581304 /NCGR_PEP_ID=MMETSP0190_2-20130828/65737_1 /ASSEMBLY_ACC=CAM_ASM_000263 /TAXON_ID=37353 /ORGANISM="Rosalina sp." /LENGTH=40 /DNA_ID= /DNA_START= /DNA_END= /DNA_ORIENTATION=